MPFELVVRPDRKFLVITIHGPFSLQDFTEATEQITHSSEFPPDIPVLWDARHVDTMPFVDAEYERRLIAIRGNYPERGQAKIAIVVATAVGYGMSRMYEMLSTALPQHVMPFKDYEAAERWLLEP